MITVQPELYIGAGYAAYYQSGRAAREFRDKKQPE